MDGHGHSVSLRYVSTMFKESLINESLIKKFSNNIMKFSVNSDVLGIVLAFVLCACSCNGNRGGSGSTEGEGAVVQNDEELPGKADLPSIEGDSVMWCEKYDYGNKIDSIYAVVNETYAQKTDSDYAAVRRIIDSMLIAEIYPKPEVVLKCDDNRELELAQRVASIYSDVLETYNYSYSSDRDFIALYCTEAFSEFIRYATENEVPPAICPFTESQEHCTMHLHQVEVAQLHGDHAQVLVTMGSLDREGIWMLRKSLQMCKERNGWYINDFHCYVSFVASLIREMESVGVEVPAKYVKLISDK